MEALKIDLYRSSSGNHWCLLREPETGQLIVRHTANAASGGQVTDQEASALLSIGGSGPEFEVLRQAMQVSDETGSSP